MYIFTSIILIGYGLFHAHFIEKKKSYNPKTLFLVLWGILSVLSGVQLFGLYDFSDKVYFIVLVGCIGFSLGYDLIRFTKKRISITRSRTLHEYRINYRVLLICTCVLAAFYFLLAARTMVAIRVLGYSYEQMRTIYIRGTAEQRLSLVYGSVWVQQLELFCLRPMILAGIAVTISKYFHTLKIDLQFILMAIALSGYVMVNFGRVILMQLGVCVLLAIVITGKGLTKQQWKKLRKIIVKYVIPIGILVFLVTKNISVARKANYSNATSTLEELYDYFAIPLPLMGHWVDVVDSSGDMTYGMMFLKGFVNVIMLFLKRVGITSSTYNLASNIVNDTEIFIPLLSNHSYNAYTTLFYEFYADLRWVGVFLGSFVYGGVLGGVFKRVVNRWQGNSIVVLSLFLLLMEGFTKCFIRWEFVQTSYCLSFIWLFVWFKRYMAEDIN